MKKSAFKGGFCGSASLLSFHIQTWIEVSCEVTAVNEHIIIGFLIDLV